MINDYLNNPLVCTMITVLVRPSNCYQLVNKLIYSEICGVFESNYAFLYSNIVHTLVCKMVPSIISACRGLLVKLIITLQAHGI